MIQHERYVWAPIIWWCHLKFCSIRKVLVFIMVIPNWIGISGTNLFPFLGIGMVKLLDAVTVERS
jgi:hypothetical protein